MPLPSATDIAKLIKTGATIEAQEKIMELRQTAMDRQEEILALREEIQSLKSEISTLSVSSLPNCPKCGKPTWSLKESKKDDMMGDAGAFRRLYECDACGFSENPLEY